MSRRLSLTLAAAFVLAGSNLALSQDTPAGTAPAPAAASPTDSAAPTADDLAKLQAENATLKKEVADATHTIAQLQAKLAAQAGTSPSVTPSGATPAIPAEGNAAADTTPGAPTAPSGPQRALPLDSTNAMSTAAAPGSPATDSGPTRSYTVVKGDSLWKIAHKMYPGDTKNGVDKLQEANKDAIGGKPLKIGQVLIIPQ